MQRIGDQQKRRGRGRVSSVLFLVFLALVRSAFAAPAASEVRAGMDESEYDRLRRPGAGRGIPDFLSPEALAGLSDEVIASIQREFAARGRLQVQSDRYLDYDEDRNIIYSNARTRIRFEQYMLEADRVLVHVPLQEIQAEGNVILRAWSDPALKVKTDEVRCKSLVFSYKYFQGAANEVSGQHDVLFFKCNTSKSGLPGFQMVGRDEVVFRNVDFTTCDFPDPQYRLHTNDAILVFKDRLFVRNAVVYLRHIPVMILPAYTKSLREPMPWDVSIGFSNRLGPYLSVRYNLYHYRYEPSFEDPEELELRDRGHLQVGLDLLSRRGIGASATYDYSLDFEKHRGHLGLYGLPSDRYRRVPGGGDTSRWQIFERHRSEIGKNLTLHVNMDYVSDPEFYYDLFDPLQMAGRHGRVPERRGRAALTYWADDYVARALVDVKERITRDRVTNTAEPTDDDADYDLYPGSTESQHYNRRDGLSPSRYGLVSLRLPQLTFSTNHIRIGGQSPLFYTLDVNAFNSLDKGLNFQSRRDDSFVLGLDIYQQLSYLIKFSQRYTLLAQVGAGLGFMKRLDDSYHWTPDDFRREDGTFRTDMAYVDDNTFRLRGRSEVPVSTRFVGPSGGLYRLQGGREVSLSDYQPFFAYGDAKLRFQGRFTDSLTGNVSYILREGVKDSLGEFYESIGNKTAREDLYNYRIRKHWLTADLAYRLAYPEMSFAFTGGRNLQSRSDIYANEPIHFAGFNTQYRNSARTLRLGSSVNYEQRQMRNPGDPYAYRRDGVSGGVQGAYAPVHRRWWIEGDLFLWKSLTSDPNRSASGSQRFVEHSYARQDDSDYRFFSEYDSDVILETWIGRKFGEKWTVELGAEWQEAYSGFHDVRLILSRDLHNALAQMGLRYHLTPYEDEQADMHFNFNIQFKLPGPVDTVMAPRARILMNERRILEIAEDPLGI